MIKYNINFLKPDWGVCLILVFYRHKDDDYPLDFVFYGVPFSDIPMIEDFVYKQFYDKSVSLEFTMASPPDDCFKPGDEEIEGDINV